MYLKDVLEISDQDVVKQSHIIIYVIKDVLPNIYESGKQKYWSDIKIIMYVLDCSWTKITCGTFLATYLRYKNLNAFS